MRRPSLACLVRGLWLLLLALNAFPSGVAATQVGEKGAIIWASNLTAALEQASIERRPVLLSFFTSWCGWCRRLERETYTDRGVIERSRRFVNLQINATREPDLAKEHGVRAYPTHVFLNADGTRLERVQGYLTADQMARLLDRLLDSGAQEFTLRQRLRDHPQLFEVRRDLAMLLMRRGNTLAGLAHLDTLIEGGSARPREEIRSLRIDRARGMLGAGRAEEARQEVEMLLGEASTPDGRKAELLYLGAEAALAGGKDGQARRWYLELLQLRSDGWLAEKARERLAEAG